MKILLVTPRSKDTVLGTIGSYCEDALRGLGCELEVFDFRRSRYLNSGIGPVVKKTIKKFFPASTRQSGLVGLLERERMNKELLLAVERFRPDVLFVLMGDSITPETLRQVRQMGVVTVNWFHDSVLAPIRRPFVEEVSPFYDYFFMIDSEAVLKHVKIGARQVCTLPLGCAPSCHRRVALTEDEKKEYGSEVSFVGTVKFGRAEVLKSLSGLGLGIWGYWLEKIPELEGCYRRRHVFGEEAVKVYNASKVVVDIHEKYASGEEYFNVTPRVFEVPASGALLLVNENPLLAGLYKPGEEIVCYKDAADLREKVKYYLARPAEREAIAGKGRRRALRDHTYEQRLKEILSVVEGEKP
ncbi:MAG: glycosyltransferase [Elusimicrobia bacterium]|nr:glycosyltransferase [Elusimicrobiota bacterium]